MHRYASWCALSTESLTAADPSLLYDFTLDHPTLPVEFLSKSMHSDTAAGSCSNMLNVIDLPHLHIQPFTPTHPYSYCGQIHTCGHMHPPTPTLWLHPPTPLIQSIIHTPMLDTRSHISLTYVRCTYSTYSRPTTHAHTFL